MTLVTANARTGSVRPSRSCRPGPPARSRCRRAAASPRRSPRHRPGQSLQPAARLGVSPTSTRSRASSSPTRSPTTTDRDADARRLGDGVLAHFGWPQGHEDEAERSVGATATGLVPQSCRSPACRRRRGLPQASNRCMVGMQASPHQTHALASSDFNRKGPRGMFDDLSDGMPHAAVRSAATLWAPIARRPGSSGLRTTSWRGTNQRALSLA